jgi:hypothetical protein
VSGCSPSLGPQGVLTGDNGRARGAVQRISHDLVAVTRAGSVALMAGARTGRPARVASRRVLVLFCLAGVFLAGFGIVELASGSGVSRWVGGCGELVGGVVILAGVAVEYRRTRRRGRPGASAG